MRSEKKGADSLVDDLVFEFDEPKPEEPKKPRPVVYCVTCDECRVGVGTVSIQAKPVGKPGEWSAASFLGPA